MNTSYQQLNIRLSPELRQYLKKRAPENMSRYVQELIRKDALDNTVDDEVVRRIARQVARDPEFKDAVGEMIRESVRLLTTEY